MSLYCSTKQERLVPNRSKLVAGSHAALCLHSNECINVIMALTGKAMLRRSERAYLLCFHFPILSELCCCSAYFLLPASLFKYMLCTVTVVFLFLLHRHLSFFGGFVFFLSTYHHITVLSRSKFYPTPQVYVQL